MLYNSIVYYSMIYYTKPPFPTFSRWSYAVDVAFKMGRPEV